MTHPVHRVVRFGVVGPFVLEVHFDDGVTRVIDFRPVLAGEMYGPLRDQEFFERVVLDPATHTLVWPNGADFDPATLHGWPDVAGEFAEMARKWRAR